MNLESVPKVFQAVPVEQWFRGPDGLVHEGLEYDEVCAELTEKLTALVDPETGEKVFEKVLRTDEIYSGERVRDHTASR